MKKIIAIVALPFLMSSCSSIFNGLVAPNQCQKCDVVNKLNNEVLWSIDGCGSENTNLEEQAKVKAYDLSHDFFNPNMCDLEVRCVSWKQEKEENKDSTNQVIQHRQ